MSKNRQKGDLAEEKFRTRCVEKDYGLSKPISEEERYDFVLDLDGELLRVQVKHGRPIRDGDVLEFNVASVNNDGTRNTYTEKEIDAFGVYAPIQDQCFLIPIDQVKAEKIMYLRLVGETKNNQQKKVNFSSQYRF